ncbi:MAG: hypothetical protein WC371_04990 [Parachlamydiales bacterium]|jgi:flagellar biogenesis protein FliO
MRRYLFLFLGFCFFSGLQAQPVLSTAVQTSVLESPIEKAASEETAMEYQPVEFKGAFVKMLFWLAVLIVFLFITLYTFKKLSRSRLDLANQTKAIKILEKRQLSPKTMLYLIEFEGKKALVGESDLELKINFFEKK